MKITRSHAFWPLADIRSALHMSAFGGKACDRLRSPLSRSLIGVKRTRRFAAQMSAYDPKRTWALALRTSAFGGKADMAYYTAYVCF